MAPAVDDEVMIKDENPIASPAPDYSNEKVSGHLEEISTKERIKLVDNDSTRRLGQLIIGFILVGSMIGYLGWYTVTQSDADFRLGLAEDMRVLIIMAIGAALAIFGLGRSVGRK